MQQLPAWVDVFDEPDFGGVWRRAFGPGVPSDLLTDPAFPVRSLKLPAGVRLRLVRGDSNQEVELVGPCAMPICDELAGCRCIELSTVVSKRAAA